jgi:hypothetical protein
MGSPFWGVQNGKSDPSFPEIRRIPENPEKPCSKNEDQKRNLKDDNRLLDV